MNRLRRKSSAQHHKRQGASEREERDIADIFISYSHTSKKHMLIFRKHLEGLLFRKATIWCDQDIPRGEKWEINLQAALNKADAALILVTPDYLASEWCRRELAQITLMHIKKRMKKVFWVQVAPAGWRGTELDSFQSWKFNVNQALTEIREANLRERTIVKICEDVALAMETVVRSLDSSFAFVRDVIMDHSIEKGLVIDSPISEQGIFMTVCRGRRGNEDVAIKVLKPMPIKALSDEFSDHADGRMHLTNQCFIKVLDHFIVGSRQDRYRVIVEEFVPTDAIRVDQYLKTQAFSVGEVAILLRRAAEAFKQFHDVAELKKRKKSYGLLTPQHVYYDRRGHKLLIPAIGVSNFLWHTIGWDRLALWQEDSQNAAMFVAPEQVSRKTPSTSDNERVSHKTDQYMLGQLAFLMLEGRLPFDVRSPGDVQACKEQFWKNARNTAKKQWPETHQALATIIFKMLRRDPSERWNDFDEIIYRLMTMEDDNRALAKMSYLGLKPGHFRLKDNQRFFRLFYDEFFKQVPTAKHKFKRLDQQPQKLMDAMVAVLNFHAGNEPTSLSNIVRSHLKYGITEKELTAFQESFQKILERELPRELPLRLEISHAWGKLFSSVTEYFKEELQRAERMTREGKQRQYDR
ncbi:MAG: TIR domain-containing protein [Nitrospira sp.]|nr:TIR domain-containing protein [Nitrospira sp.]